jgi:hypothetical protein
MSRKSKTDLGKSVNTRAKVDHPKIVKLLLVLTGKNLVHVLHLRTATLEQHMTLRRI